MKGIYPLPKEGGCPKGGGLAEGEKNEANLRRYFSLLQRKEGEVAKTYLPPFCERREKSFSPL